MIGVIDSCFIIDWCKFRYRELLKKLFSLLYLHEETLAQLKSEDTILFTSKLLSEGKLRLYPWSQSEEDEFLLLRSEIIGNSRIPSLERPDMLCLIIAKNLNAILISENLGIHRVIEFHPRYRNVKIWTALEVIENMVYKGIFNVSSKEEYLRYVRQYESDTGHVFKMSRLTKSIERVELWLRK